MTSDWLTLRTEELIADRALVINDGYRAKNSEMGPDGLPFIRAGDIDGRISVEGTDVLAAESVVRAGEKVSEPGDALFTSKGTVGRFAFVSASSPRFVYSPQLCFWRVRDRSRLDPRFVFFWLQGPEAQGQLHALKGQTDMADYVSLRDQRAMTMTLPLIDEQRRIASVLAALDDKIEHNRVLGQRLQDLARARVRVGCRNASGSTSAYDVASVAYGAAYKSQFFGVEGTPLLRIRDLVTHAPDVKTTELLPKSRLVQRSDIVVGMDGEFRAHLWHGPDSLLNQRVCVFDPLEGISRAFVWEAIREPLAFVEATEAGTTVIHLGKADIDHFEVPKLSHAEMNHLVVEVDPLVELSTLLLAECSSLLTIRDALLPKLVSGKIRVPESYVP
jgi:type I restriction enzyme, S subunit